PPLWGGDATPQVGGTRFPIILADLPGYGYAKASKTDIDKWAARLEKYLMTRSALKRLFILVDARHGLKPSDRDMMHFCDANGIPYQLILTKSDKVKKGDSEKLRNEIDEEIKTHGVSCGAVIATSAEKKTGIEELKATITK
ncbi:MAG: YihA family ribosome biogenesis GTP-binding protein, partial [Proteobacteria bacterium]|nr:YihA family ribosome biogenesis GTP-binding protein [Pseudomonadota bacterium]